MTEHIDQNLTLQSASCWVAGWQMKLVVGMKSSLLLLQQLRMRGIWNVLVVVNILCHLCWGEQGCVQLLADGFLTHASTNEHNLLAPATRAQT